LEEALLAAKGKIMINLDKADRYFDQVYELLQKTGTTEQIIMKGSKPAKEVKARFGKYLDEVIYMPIVNLDKEDAKRHIDVFVEICGRPLSNCCLSKIATHCPECLPIR